MHNEIVFQTIKLFMVIKDKTEEQLIKTDFEYFLQRNQDRFNSPEQIQLLKKAFKFAYKAHENMVRYSGEPYIKHSLEVAKIVIEKIGLGTTSCAAALLHDVANKTEYDTDDIKRYFGDKIYSIVNSLKKIKNTEYFENHAQASVLREILLSVSDDIRVIFIKIADKLHNIRTLEHVSKESQNKFIDEILNIYAPLSHRLGLYEIKTEMEDICLKFSNPYIYNQIKEKLQSTEKDRIQFINQFIQPINEKLSENKINFKIEGRPKSIFSIWKKMQTKGVPFEEIYDLFAIRIIFKPQISENIETLQIGSYITDLYEENKERKRNWLNLGKDTGYRALHVTVMSNEGKWVEVQIRSEEMHEIAEHGYAAHWKYKGLSEKKTEFDEKVKEILDYLNEDNSSAITFIDNLKLNLFTSEIYVFTPKGDVINLPKGASVLDFAFKIHTNIALKSIAGKVNGKSQSLDYILKNGDQIEVLTTKKENITKSWSQIVITQKAKYQINKYYKTEIKQTIQNGEIFFNTILTNFGITNNNKCIEKIAKHLKYRSKDKLYEAIGEKNILVFRLKEAVKKYCFEEKSTKFWKIKLPFSGSEKNSAIENEFSSKYKIAKCCNPIPGDEIIGVKDPKGDITIYIHDKNCLTAQTEVAFGSYSYHVQWTSYKAISVLKEIKISGIDEPGLLTKIITTVSKNLSVNINSLVYKAEKEHFKAKLKVYTHQENFSAKLIKQLNKIPAIKSIEILK